MNSEITPSGSFPRKSAAMVARISVTGRYSRNAKTPRKSVFLRALRRSSTVTVSSFTSDCPRSPLHDPAGPAPVALVDRLVEVQVVAEDLALLRGRLAPEHPLGDVAGQHAW